MKGKLQRTNLFEIGSTIKIDFSMLEDNIPIELSKAIKNDPFCEVIDYKMTDGTGIGVVVRLKDGKEMWLFNNEIYDNERSTISQDKKQSLLEIEQEQNIIIKKGTNIDGYTNTKNINDLINPINFTKWLIYSSKDII